MLPEFDSPSKTGAYIAAGLVLFVVTFAVERDCDGSGRARSEVMTRDDYRPPAGTEPPEGGPYAQERLGHRICGSRDCAPIIPLAGCSRP
jgi:hypothetical protein